MPTPSGMAKETTLQQIRDADIGVTRDLLAATATIAPGTPLDISPTASKKIRVWWIAAIPDPDNSSFGAVTVTLAGKGVLYRAFAIGHRQRFDGETNGHLVVASEGGAYEVTVHYEEIT